MDRKDTKVFADCRYALQEPEAAVAHIDPPTIANPASGKRLELV